MRTLFLVLAFAISSSCSALSPELDVYAVRDITTQSGDAVVSWKLRAQCAGESACAPTPVGYQIQWLDAFGSVLLAASGGYGALPVHASGPSSDAVARYRVRVRFELPADSMAAAAPPARWTDWVAALWRRVPGTTVSEWGGGAASWICTGPTSTDFRASMLRTEFALPAGRSSVAAVAHVVGLGQFQLRVNGADVGGDANVPGWTTWSKRVLFSSYTVPGLHAGPGLNAIAVTLGNGMYNVPNPAPRYTKWVGSSGPRTLLLLLDVTLDDGSHFNVSSAPGAAGGWLATDGGPIVFTHQYAGEDFNATLAVPGWDAPGFDPASNPLVQWAPAQSCAAAAPAGQLLPADFDPVRVMETLPALNVTPSQPPGTLLVDVGRNFAGYAEVQLAGVPPGSTVRVWPSETVVDGQIQQASGGTPMYWQTFVPPAGANANLSRSGAAAAGVVTVRPTFSTYGWRWLAVQVLPPSPAKGEGNSPEGDNNGTLSVLSATYGANCDASLAGDETAAVAAWCGANATTCTFQVCVCGDNTCGPGAPPCIKDPAANCAKAFSVSWRCSLDPPGSNRTAELPAEADNNAVVLNCLPPPPVPLEPVITSATGYFTRSSVSRVGNWTSSNAWVNRIHNITVEAIASNLQSVLTDCPHRERLGWLEVSHLAFPAIAFNYDVSRLWAKISHDTVDTQLASGMVPDIAPEYTVFSGGFRDSPEWGSASVLNPFWLHSWYGDDGIINATYATAVSYVAYLLSQVNSSTGLLAYGLGDWIPVVPSPIGVTATGILVQDLQALAVAASVLSRPADAARYTALAANASAAFQAAYWNGSAYPTQCAAGIALALNITPPSAVAAAQTYLVGDVLARGNVTTSGEIGNRYALLALAGIPAGAGNAAVWASLLRSDAPGYGWMLTMGETALAETWFDSASDSHIHAMYGHIDEWLYRYVAGIQQDPTEAAAAEDRASESLAGASGWGAVVIAPSLLPGLEWLEASFDSPRGLIFVRVALAASASGTGGLRLPLAVAAVSGSDSDSTGTGSANGSTTARVFVTAEVPPGVVAHVVLPLSGTRVRLIAGKRVTMHDSDALSIGTGSGGGVSATA